MVIWQQNHAACRFLELLQENKSKLPAVEVSKFKEQTPLPPYNPGTPPVLVLGGDSDYTVDVEGLKETADHYGVQPVILPDLAHDLMLVPYIRHPPPHLQGLTPLACCSFC